MDATTENVKSGIWARALDVIKGDILPQSFDTWFTPIRQVGIDNSSISLEVPNQFFKDWVIDHYKDYIEQVLEKVCEDKVQVDLVVSSRGDDMNFETPATPAAIPRENQAKLLQSIRTYSELNPKYTFDSFVVGSSNRFAHAASIAVSDSPAKSYNPLFIYGKVGLGKTHLMHSIGNRIHQRAPQTKILYISSEKFTNQLISAIQSRSTPNFRKLYRSVDVLLIDDIQFIAGKESTQEEFFHTFNALHDSHKQIVLSSDRPPKEIHSLEERLVSRFDWGLVTDMQAPDLETRVAILKMKAQRETIHVPDEVIFFIAERIRSNIRELEGALIRTVAYSKLIGQEVTTSLAKNILRDMFVEEASKITVDLIQQKVASYFDIRLSEMKSKRRTKAVAYPRQVAMYLVRELTDYSLPEIGEYFGGRDHTTVIYACNKVQGDAKKDGNAKAFISRLISDIKG